MDQSLRRERVLYILYHTLEGYLRSGGVMLVVSDSVTALLPIFSTNEEGVGGDLLYRFIQR